MVLCQICKCIVKGGGEKNQLDEAGKKIMYPFMNSFNTFTTNVWRVTCMSGLGDGRENLEKNQRCPAGD